MLVRLLSDTHLETGRDIQVPPMQEDLETVLVLAGDIGYPEDIKKLISELHDKFKYIIYITGNHEFYDRTSDIEEIKSDISAMLDKYENVHYLENTYIVLDGVTFIGATLWSNILNDIEQMGSVKHSLSDFRIVKVYNEETGKRENITPQDMAEFNKESVRYLEDILARTSGEIVVVTHFSPSMQSTHLKYFGSKLNPYFHNRLEYLLEENKVTWLHGHTHASCDYKVGKSRVLCNPWGYYDIYVENPEYDPYLRIEV